MDKPVDLEAVQRILGKAARVLDAYPELQESNPESQQALEAWLATLEQGDTSMAYKPTGNPVGRPKTKEYTTVLARIPQELADLVERYRAAHGKIPMAALIRDGLEWRVGDGDPRGTGLYLGESRGISEKTYYINTETAPGMDNSAMLEDMRGALARQEAQIQALVQALERQTTPAGNGMYSSNTTIEPAGQERAEAPMPERMQGSGDAPGYDTSKRHLGKLCPRGHDHEGSGHSMRNADNQCLRCNAERKAAKDAKKRQAKAATT